MDKPIDFEIAMKELETVVSELDGEVKLERALNLFEQGMKLSKQCEEFLQGAEQRIEMLKRGEGGALVAVPVAGDTIEAVAVAAADTATTPGAATAAAALKVDNSDAEKKRKKVSSESGDMVVREIEGQLGLFGEALTLQS